MAVIVNTKSTFFYVMYWLTQWLAFYYDHKPKVEIQMKQNAFRQAPCDSLRVSLLLSKLSYYVPFCPGYSKACCSWLFSCCCGLTAFFFCLFVTCVFFSLLVVHVRWGSLKKPVYLHLRGSGPLHDETKIWRCNPNHRQPISRAFHKSLVKYVRLFLPRARALVFTVNTSGSESAFRNTWMLDVMKKLKPIKIHFSWISKRETSIIWEIQTFGECRVPAESMSGK